jgi:hypothetical protein
MINAKRASWKRPVDPKNGKPYTEMTTEELREATKEFDRPFVSQRRSRPMTKAERAEYRRTTRPCRPRVGQGAKRVLITVEQGLLRRADAFAKSRHLTRSQLISRGIEAYMSSAA